MYFCELNVLCTHYLDAEQDTPVLSIIKFIGYIIQGFPFHLFRSSPCITSSQPHSLTTPEPRYPQTLAVTMAPNKVVHLRQGEEVIQRRLEIGMVDFKVIWNLFKASHPGRAIKRYRASKPAVLPKVIGKVIRQGQGRSTTGNVELEGACYVTGQ